MFYKTAKHMTTVVCFRFLNSCS